MAFLFRLLLGCNDGRWKAVRDLSLLVYLLHPACVARVAVVRSLAAGETAGYGRAFTTVRPTRLAIVTIGYADGLPRSLSAQGGRVLVRGGSCPMVGRICMDQLLVDVTDLPDAAGNIVTLIGRDGAGCIPAEELAARCGTITNEILARLGARLALWQAGRSDKRGKTVL